MGDFRLEDAVRLYCGSSRTVMGATQGALGGNDAHRSRYITLARDVKRKLQDRISQTNKVAFADLGDTWGLAYEGRGLIEISDKVEPERSANNYLNSKNQQLVAIISIILVHEAGHLCRSNHVLTEEVTGRTLSILLYKELKIGLRYKPTHSSSYITLSLTGGDPIIDKFISQTEEQSEHRDNGNLIDFILSGETYSSTITASWIRDNIDFWGGPENRWPSTIALYVWELGRDAAPGNVNYIMRLLEAIVSRNAFGVVGFKSVARKLSNFSARVAQVVQDHGTVEQNARLSEISDAIDFNLTNDNLPKPDIDKPS